MAGAVSFVERKLKQRSAVLFCKRRSPECNVVLSILDSYHMKPGSYEVCEIDRRQDCTQIENYFQTTCLTNRREVPRLFVHQKYVGGYEEILRWHEEDTLWERLPRK